MTTPKYTSEDYLHSPARAADLRSIADHTSAASGMSRALYVMLTEFDLDDPRDRDAVHVLASAVADHASAADLLAGQLPPAVLSGATSGRAAEPTPSDEQIIEMSAEYVRLRRVPCPNEEGTRDAVMQRCCDIERELAGMRPSSIPAAVAMLNVVKNYDPAALEAYDFGVLQAAMSGLELVDVLLRAGHG